MKTCGNGHTVIFWDEETPWGCPLCVSRQNAADLRCRLDTAREERDIKTGLITYWKERAEEAEKKLSAAHEESRRVWAVNQRLDKELTGARRAVSREQAENGRLLMLTATPDLEARVNALEENAVTQDDTVSRRLSMLENTFAAHLDAQTRARKP